MAQANCSQEVSWCCGTLWKYSHDHCPWIIEQKRKNYRFSACIPVRNHERRITICKCGFSATLAVSRGEDRLLCFRLCRQTSAPEHIFVRKNQFRSFRVNFDFRNGNFRKKTTHVVFAKTLNTFVFTHRLRWKIIDKWILDLTYVGKFLILLAFIRKSNSTPHVSKSKQKFPHQLCESHHAWIAAVLIYKAGEKSLVKKSNLDKKSILMMFFIERHFINAVDKSSSVQPKIQKSVEFFN